MREIKILEFDGIGLYVSRESSISLLGAKARVK